MSALLGAIKGGRILRGAARGIGRAARGIRRPGMRRKRRRRGISGAELRGFFKVAGLLASVGMRPRGLARPFKRRRRGPFGFRRRGDPSDEGDGNEGDAATEEYAGD